MLFIFILYYMYLIFLSFRRFSNTKIFNPIVLLNLPRALKLIGGETPLRQCVGISYEKIIIIRNKNNIDNNK